MFGGFEGRGYASILVYCHDVNPVGFQLRCSSFACHCLRMKAVGRAASAMVVEVQEQWRRDPRILVKPHLHFSRINVIFLNSIEVADNGVYLFFSLL